MSKRALYIAIPASIVVITLLVFAGLWYHEWRKLSSTTVDSILLAAADKRENATTTPAGMPSTTSTASELLGSKKINILLLGLDARKSATTSPHCDAIHLFTLDLDKMTVDITSVPRGTYTYIPPGTYAPNQYYLGNACELAGHEYTIKQIEKILGVKADHIIKVGFSQTLGVLRVFSLPTTESLRWLRNRQSFRVGDPQRSHNQAMFMRDVLLQKIDTLKNPALLPLLKIAYSYTETDIDFTSLYVLLKAYQDSGLAQHPERIRLHLKSKVAVADYHFDFKDPQKFLDTFTTPALVRTSTLSQAQVQQDIITYLEKRLIGKQSIQDVVQKQLWLQIDDEATRERLHFASISKQITETADPHEQAYILDAYIFEQKALGQLEWAEKGQLLFDTLSSSTLKTK